jgi:quercetin dioxygenase-like cupin family protein
MRNHELGKSSQIVDMVDYQEDAIVSKTVLDEENGAITLYSLWSEQGISEQTLPYDNLYFIIEGTLEVIADNSKHNLSGDYLIKIPKNTPHQLVALQNSKIMSISIKDVNNLDSKKETLKVYSIKDTINYNDDSVVSKTIIRKKTGTITMFAFDTNKGLLEHEVPFEAFIYIPEGILEAEVIGKGKITGKTGDLLSLPANIPHTVTAKEKCKIFLVMIREASGNGELSTKPLKCNNEGCKGH